VQRNNAVVVITGTLPDHHADRITIGYDDHLAQPAVELGAWRPMAESP
jgi:hypothetical protein